MPVVGLRRVPVAAAPAAVTTFAEAAAEVVAAIKGFLSDLRAKGVHIGVGEDPRCVVDDEPWPCAAVRSGNVAPGR